MEMKNVGDMKKLGSSGKGKTEDYNPPKYLVQPHEGDEMYPFVEKEYLKAKKESEKKDSPFITTSYKKFVERQKKNATGSSTKKGM